MERLGTSHDVQMVIKYQKLTACSSCMFLFSSSITSLYNSLLLMSDAGKISTYSKKKKKYENESMALPNTSQSR